MVKVLPSPQCDPAPVFLPPQKPNITKFQFDLESEAIGLLVAAYCILIELTE